MQDKVDQAVRFVRARCPGYPSVGVAVGSGWASLVDASAAVAVIPYAEIPGFPQCSVEGHPGSLVLSRAWGPLAAVLHGRAHRYEGFSLQEVVFPIRVLAAWGVKTLVVTNASGGLQGVEPGDLALITDHINLMGDNPLIGIGSAGPRFVDMVETYDAGLLRLAETVAREERIPLRRGTLAAVPGPSYETPAEAQMLRTLGAHMVCMSTVPEVIVARASGLRVLGLSLITNMAGSAATGGLTHEAVLEMGRQNSARAGRLLGKLLGRLDG